NSKHYRYFFTDTIDVITSQMRYGQVQVCSEQITGRTIHRRSLQIKFYSTLRFSRRTSCHIRSAKREKSSSRISGLLSFRKGELNCPGFDGGSKLWRLWRKCQIPRRGSSIDIQRSYVNVE